MLITKNITEGLYMDVFLSIKDALSPFLSFLSVEPYPKYYILWVSGFCMLVAVAGGGNIKINDQQIGHLGVVSRWIAGIISLVILSIFFIVPSPNLSISGLFSDATFEDSNNDQYEIRLTPQKLIKKTRIGQEGIFRFDEEHEVTEGVYLVTIIKNGNDVVFNKEYTADHSHKHILVVKDGDGYKIETSNPFEYFVNEYMFENRDWMIKYRDLRHLTDIAKEEKEIRTKLLAQINSPDIKKKTLALFVLGDLGIEEAKLPLLDVINDKKNVFNIWQKLRAASQLWNYEGNLPKQNKKYKVFAYDYLMDHLLKKNIIENNRDVTEAVNSTAARHLAERRYNNKCVIESLIAGVDNRNSEISSEYSRILMELTGITSNSNYNQWVSWWRSNNAEYPECA
jgi:hypothetical protein